MDLAPFLLWGLVPNGARTYSGPWLGVGDPWPGKCPRVHEAASCWTSNEHHIELHPLFYLSPSGILQFLLWDHSTEMSLCGICCCINTALFPQAENCVCGVEFGRKLYIFSDLKKIHFDLTTSQCGNNLWFSTQCFWKFIWNKKKWPIDFRLASWDKDGPPARDNSTLEQIRFCLFLVTPCLWAFLYVLSMS